MFNGSCRAGFLRNSLKLRRDFVIKGLEFRWSAFGKVLKHAEMPFRKPNRKSRIMKHFHLFAVLGLCYLGALTPVKAQNDNFNALQTHFERVTTARFENLFSRIENAKQWKGRKEQIREALYKMLWHDRRWPDSPPQFPLAASSSDCSLPLRCCTPAKHCMPLSPPAANILNQRINPA